jgi:nitroreductase
VVAAHALVRWLRVAAVGQETVERAAAVVVFCADPRAARENLQPMLDAEVVARLRPQAHAELARRLALLYFGLGPLGLLGWAKKLLVPLLRLVRPLPAMPASPAALREWAARETMLAAQTFLLAARSLGLHTCPLNGFDEGRVKRILGIPRRMGVPLLVPVGYAEPGCERGGVGLPLSGKVSWNRWGASSAVTEREDTGVAR